MGLYQQAADLQRDSQDAHIRLLGLDFTAHKAAKGAYEDGFAAAHDLGELLEACGKPTGTEDDCGAILKKLIFEWTKWAAALESAIKGEKDEALKAEYQVKLATARIRIKKLESAVDKD
jgi:hypothetical protein